jgi:hypothetical protein
MASVTQALPRPSSATAARRATRESDGLASVWVRGGCAALSAAAVGVATLIVVVLGVWAADARSGASAAAAVRVALAVWLVAQKVPLHVSGGTFALAPLGLTALLALLLARAATVVARGSRCSSGRDVAAVVLAVTGPYTLLVAVVAVLATTGRGAAPGPAASVLAGLVVGGVAAGAGALRGSGMARRWWDAAPADLRAALDAGVTSLAVLAAAAILLTVATVGSHLGREQAGVERLGGVPAMVSVTVLCVLLLPNAVGAALAYLTGPGFALGAGTSLGLGGAHVAATPALPLLAAAPHGRPPAAVVGCCVVAVVLAALSAGWRVGRRPVDRLLVRSYRVAAGGAVAATLAAVLTALADGPAGPGRLAVVGGSPWQVGLAVGGEVAVGGVITVLVTTWWQRGRPVPAVPALVRAWWSHLDGDRGDELVGEGLPLGVPERPQPPDQTGQ